MALREILVEFLFKADHSELKHGESAVEALIDKIKGLGTAVVGAFVGHEVKEFFESTIHGARELAKQSTTFGIAAQDLQGLQHAADMCDVSTESLNMGLRFLQRSMYVAGEGGSSLAAGFRKLGVETKDANGNHRASLDVLADMADKISALPDQAQRAGLSIQLMGRHGMALLPMLSKKGDEIRKYASEVESLGGGYTDEFLEASEEVEQQQKLMNFQWRSLRVAIVGELIPAATTLMGWLGSMRQGLQDLNKHVSLGQAVLAGLFGLALSKLPSVVKLIQSMGLATAKTFFWFGLMFLAVDDLMTLFKGGESISGDLLNHFFGEGAAQTFVADVKAMTESWQSFKDGLTNFAGSIGAEITNWLVTQADLCDNWVKRLLKVLDVVSRIQSFFAGESQADYTKRVNAEYESDKAIINEQSGARSEANAASYRAEFDRIRDAAATKRIVEAREEQLGKSRPVHEEGPIVFGSPETISKQVSGAPAYMTDARQYIDRGVVNVNTLPATTADQARKVGEAVTRAKRQIGEGRRAVNETDLVPE